MEMFLLADWALVHMIEQVAATMTGLQVLEQVLAVTRKVLQEQKLV